MSLTALLLCPVKAAAAVSCRRAVSAVGNVLRRIAAQATYLVARRASKSGDAHGSRRFFIPEQSMQPTDMRSLSPRARRERRVQVVQLRAAGHTYAEVAAQTGVSRTGVFDICHRVQSTGSRALDGQRNTDVDSGRRTLDGPLSTEIRKLITTQLPDRLSLPYTLWTNVAVAQLVHQRFGVPISERNTALHLARWGFKPHSPLRKEQQSTPLATALWLKGHLSRHQDAGRQRRRRDLLGRCTPAR